MKIKDQIGGWYYTSLLNEFRKPYMKELSAKLRAERMYQIIHPKKENVFRAYRCTDLKDIKVVILGMDPYPHNYANGLAFSAEERIDQKIPASLRNIFKEVEHTEGFQPYHNPDLGRWAKQGVFLLNTRLTVRDKQPGSHLNYGWQNFTEKTIELICNKEDPVVFLLWGSLAKEYANYITAPHTYYYAPHPSPLSAYRGFLGCCHFQLANEFLKKNNKEPINWLHDEE